MKKLYAPWRRFYAQSVEDRKQGLSIDKESPQPCIFCTLAAQSDQDEKNFVLERFKHSFVMLNLYPYNGGHVLIVPYSHVETLDQLTADTRSELIEAANKIIRALEKELEPDGFNIGMNIGGKAAGGSIPDHIHMHVLPRWYGDTSFLPTLADTKPISEDLRALYIQLKGAL